ncbi:hypothetical protein GC207_06865 [bacterium]|nr:hypothetical protein [bacterium]
MKRLLDCLLLAGVVLLGAGCSTVRVRVSGDAGVTYHAAWSTADVMTTTRSGKVPKTFWFDGDFSGWFQNASGEGHFRVRVYEGMGLLVDESLENSARKIVIEHKGKRISYRID